MISGENILITGVTGMVATPLAHFLAQENEAWGIARLADPNSRLPYEAAGIKTRGTHIGAGDISDLPNDFTSVIHHTWLRADLSQLQKDISNNLEGPGRVFPSTRKEQGTLVMSGTGLSWSPT